MICEPLELEYIAANIEPLGHTCTIIDMIIEKRDVDFFVKKYTPDVVGITGYISHVNIIKDYAKKVKEVDPAIKTIVGGVHAEVNPGDFESPYVDYIIRANGIRTFIDILNFLEKKGDTKEPECVYSKDRPAPHKDTTFDYRFPSGARITAGSASADR